MATAAALTQSAGALLLGIPLSAAAVILLILGRRGLMALVGLGAVGAAGLALALRSPRFARVLDFSEGTSFIRLRVWQSAVEMLMDRPLTGLGLDQFLYAYRGRYILPDAWQEPNLSHPHNVLLDWWIRLGLLGVIVFGWLQWCFWRRTVSLYRAFKGRDAISFALVVGVMGSMINLLAHGLVDNSVYVNDLAYVFVLLLGIAAALKQEAHVD
jgi:O-antigen ligase